MSRKRSLTYQKYLIILPLLLLLSLAGIGQAKAKPEFSLRLVSSPYRRYRKYIAAMARHESGDFTNTLSTKYNNIFSMGYPTRRPASNQGKTPKMIEGIFHSVYKNYDEAVKDLMLWFDFVNFPKDLSSVDTFAQALRDKGYYTDTVANYTRGLKTWM